MNWRNGIMEMARREGKITIRRGRKHTDKFFVWRFDRAGRLLMAVITNHGWRLL